MTFTYETEAEAIAAYDAWVNAADSRVSDTDRRKVIGVVRDGQTVTLTVQDINALDLKASIADKRWRREVCGCEVMPGVLFPTTRDVRADLSAELKDAEAIGPSYSNVYVIGDIRVPVTLETLQAVNAAVRNHVREAFAWQASMLARIESGEDLQTIAADVEAA